MSQRCEPEISKVEAAPMKISYVDAAKKAAKKLPVPKFVPNLEEIRAKSYERKVRAAKNVLSNRLIVIKLMEYLEPTALYNLVRASKDFRKTIEMDPYKAWRLKTFTAAFKNLTYEWEIPNLVAYFKAAMDNEDFKTCVDLVKGAPECKKKLYADSKGPRYAVCEGHPEVNELLSLAACHAVEVDHMGLLEATIDKYKANECATFARCREIKVKPAATAIQKGNVKMLEVMLERNFSRFHRLWKLQFDYLSLWPEYLRRVPHIIHYAGMLGQVEVVRFLLEYVVKLGWSFMIDVSYEGLEMYTANGNKALAQILVEDHDMTPNSEN